VDTLIEERMTEADAIEAHRLIQEGRAAALAGDTFAARTAFRRATELDSSNAEAWLGLSGVVPILAEKCDHLRHVLVLEPGNSDAQASLAYVEKLIGDGLQIAPSQRTQERRATGDASPLLAAPDPQPTAVAETLYCYNHSDRETGLCCVQCSRPICYACAQLTPVGQICPECRKARRPANYQFNTGNALVGGLVALGIGVLASIAVVFIAQLPFLGLFLAIAAGPTVGELAVRASDKLTRTKRGRGMQAAVAGGLVVGTLPLLIILLLAPSLMTAIGVLYTVLAATTAATRLR